MQSFTNYAIHNAGGFHQEFILDSDDDPPETNSKIIQKKQKKDDSLSSIDPLSVSVGIPSSPSSVSSNEGPGHGGLTPVAITPDHSNQNSPGPSSPDSAHGQCVLNSELHDELKAFNEAMQKADFTPSSHHHPSLPGERMPILGKSLSWVSGKLSARTTKTGCGLFCAEPVKKGEYLVVWTGRIVSAEEALSVMSTNEKHYILQIGEGFYQTPLQSEREAADLSNHSCEPTAGFGANSPICLTAIRDMNIGEEVVFDYGMCETDERLWEPMECACGSKYCRGLITANDWKREDLWDRYDGLWAPHVQKLVDRAKEEKQKNLLKEQRSLTEINAAPLDVNQSIINEDVALPPLSSSALIDDQQTAPTANPSPAPAVSDAHVSELNGSVYYKAAPLPSHWLGKLMFPLVDLLLAKVGLARVSV